MSGRQTKPLFELLRDESGEGRRPVARAPIPTIAPEIKPTRPAAPPAPREPFVREPIARAASETPPTPTASAVSVRDGVVSMSVYAAYLGLAAVLAVLVVIWVFAYNSGRRTAERDLASRLQTDLPPGFSDPRTAGSTPRDPLDSPRTEPSPRQEPKATVPPPERTATPGPNSIITATGFLADDPRTPGLNYLVLAYVVPRDEAKTIIEVLSQNGLDVIGVPTKVDRSGAGDNNAPLYKVVGTVGITKTQHGDNDPIRARQESEAKRIGQIVKRKIGGRDFASTNWELFTP